MDWRPKYRTWNYKTLRGKHLNDINQSKILCDLPPRVTEIKMKVHKWNLIKLKSFCIAKETLCQKNNPIKQWEKDLNRHFSKEDIQIGNKHMKRCSTSLIIREKPFKTTMRYHLTPVRMAIIKKSTSNKCWRGCGENGTFLHFWWECKHW